MEVLGPVTYVVDTDTGLRWKRHTDQIKEWIAAKPRVEPETEQESSGTDTAAVAVDPEYLTSGNESGTDDGDTAPPVDVPPVEETGTARTEAGSSTPTESISGATERRYPTRVRQALLFLGCWNFQCSCLLNLLLLCANRHTTYLVCFISFCGNLPIKGGGMW